MDPKEFRDMMNKIVERQERILEEQLKMREKSLPDNRPIKPAPNVTDYYHKVSEGEKIRQNGHSGRMTTPSKPNEQILQKSQEKSATEDSIDRQIRKDSEWLE